MIDYKFLRTNKDNICSSKVSYPLVNLNNISIITNLEKTYNNYPDNYKIQIFYKKQRLLYKRELDEGSFGKIILYSRENISVVVKKPKSDSDPYEELDILENYIDNMKICKHHIIPVRTVYDQNRNPFIVMQVANGNLKKLEMPDKIIKDLIREITKAFECFYKEGYAYTDMKVENVLYSCSHGKIHFYLGDIGSFVRIGAYDDDYISTFDDPNILKLYDEVR